MDYRIFLDSQAGFAINSGDIVSIFNSRSNPKRGMLDIMMLQGSDPRLFRGFA